MSSFTGKVVLVTGASSGIGKATAIEFARQGATVGLMARRGDELEKVAAEMGGKGIVLPADVTDEAAVNARVEELVSKAGGIDILIAAAGISLRAPFETTTTETIRRVLDVNFMGCVLPTRAVLPHIKARKGSLIAISSLSGRKGTPEYAVYGATKFALQGLYDGLRIEHMRDGVHFGVFCPGFVDTPLRESVLKGDGKVYETPPKLPFRLWSVDLCVSKILRMVRRRLKSSLLPGFVHYLLTADDFVFRGWISDMVLRYKFGYWRK